MIQLFINNKLHTLGTPFTLEHLLADLEKATGQSSRTLLIELNQKVLFRHEWKDCLLKENDRLEILRVAAGG